MMRLWRGWVALLMRQELATSVALVRIGVGLALLQGVLSVVASDLVDPLWTNVTYGGMRELGEGPWLIAPLGGPTPTVIWGFVGLTVLAACLLTVGLGSRLAAFVALQGHLNLTWLNGHAGGSYDDLIANALFLLVLADSGATLSVQARLRTGSWTSERLVSAWPRWLMVGQLLLMYGSTGSHKVSSYWVPGGDLSALYYILQQPTWQRWDLSVLAWVFPLTQLATLSTWLFELGAPLLLLGFWARETRLEGGRLRGVLNRLDPRVCFCLFGVGLHLGIATLMDVGPFSTITLSLYLALWHPDELAAFARRLSARSSRRGAPGTASRPAG